MTATVKQSSALRAFLKSEAAGGIVLIAAAALAMLAANLPGLSDSHFHLLHAQTGPVISPKYGPMTVHLWVNDALMAVFFLLVGLEIKREFVDGELSSWSARRLPVVAAVAGMAVPAVVYLSVAGGGELAAGWAIAIVPLFGFANAGVNLAGMSPAILLAPLPLGLALGLFVGKQVGIFGSTWIADRTAFASRPGGVSWRRSMACRCWRGSASR